MDRFTLQPGGRLGGHLRQRLHDPRLPRLARRATSATRSSPRSSRTRPTPPAPRSAGYQDHHPVPRRGRLPGPRRPAKRPSPSGRPRCSSPTPRTPASSTRGSTSSSSVVHEAGGLCRLRPGQRERHPGHHPRPRRRVSTSATSTCTRPSPRPMAAAGPGARRLRRHGRARPVPAHAHRRVRRDPLLTWTTTGPRASARSGLSTAIAPNIVRAYAWIMSLGAEGLREVAEIAVLNNNYLHEASS